MIRRIGIILLLAFEAVWLNAIVPGHTRGVVALPGESSDAAASCCASHRPRDVEDAPGKSGDPCGEQKARRCAVCYFAARLTTPPAIDLTLPPLARVGAEPVPPPPAVVSVDARVLRFDRGPPVA